MIIISELYAPLWRIHDSTIRRRCKSSRIRDEPQVDQDGRNGTALRHLASISTVQNHILDKVVVFLKNIFIFFLGFKITKLSFPLVKVQLDPSAIFDRLLMGNGSQADKNFAKIICSSNHHNSFSVSRQNMRIE